MANNVNNQLASIPLEIFLQIASNLTTVEYGNLRRTCKAVEEALFSSFSHEFFSKKQFMISEFSLQALVDISNSRLATCLKHVIIGLERPFEEPYNGLFTAHGIRLQPSQTVKYHQGQANHVTFINTSTDVEMLVESFSKLPNLLTVGMRDFCSNSRRRDSTQWKSVSKSYQSYKVPTASVQGRLYLCCI